jgi:integrase/recombinase XerD
MKNTGYKIDTFREDRCKDVVSTKECCCMPKDVEQEKQVASSNTEESTGVPSSVLEMATDIVEIADDQELPQPVSEQTLTLTDQSNLSSCSLPYRKELELRGKSNYTVTCFLSDLKMFGDFVGHDMPVGRITKQHLTAWLMKLKFGSPGPAPAPKTMARRVTFLKNFCSWLASEGVISEDPSATLALERPLPPLPELLSPDEIQRLVQAASEDPRCHCLVYLVLYAGLKKEEVMGLRIQHVDLLNPRKPLVTVHFEASAGKQHRERRLALPAEFTSIFQKYQSAYAINDTVFACTDRNLNYILARAVDAAGIQKRVTLQLLRDIFAVQQLQADVSFDALREKLGLSDEAWLETREKYRRLKDLSRSNLYN